MIVILVLIVLSLVSIALLNIFRDDNGPKTVVVKVGNEIYREIALTPETNEEFTVVTEYGYNIVNISNSEVRITEADCDDQICVKYVPAKEKGDIIVCLPHKVIIEIN